MTRRVVLPLVLGAAATLTTSAQYTNISAGLTPAENAIVWGDYDGDNDLDLISLGGQGYPGPNAFTDIYRNSSGSFAAISAGLPQLYAGGGPGKGCAWGDFDNDGDLDVAIAGSDNSGTRYTRIYQNNGASGFAQLSLAWPGITPVDHASLAWADYDNDGDLDLFVTGSTGTSTYRTTVYRNGGVTIAPFWNFVDITSPIVNVFEGQGAWGDYDGDLDLDLVVCGSPTGPSGTPSTIIYNNNAGVLSNSGIPLLGVRQGSVAWGDYDNDGDLDLAVTGVDAGSTVQARLYNNNSGVFTSVTTTIPPVAVGSLAWGDYNNDGYLDMLATGNAGSALIADVYAGNGTGTFTAIGSGLPPTVNGQATFGDYNNDGKLDIALCGFTGGSGMIARVYRNDYQISANTVPGAPSGLSTTTTSSTITVSWNAPTDGQTPQANLHYNIRVTDVTNPSSPVTVMAPMANTTLGYRHVAALGNANHNTSWTIRGLTPGHQYDVCVQAIDGALAGGRWGCADDVVTQSSGPDVMIADCSTDNGTEPNTCWDIWRSSNIWVRNQSDWTLVNQGPLSGQTNYIYVQLDNIGNGSMPSGTLHLYWSKYSASQGWPWSWMTSYDSQNRLIGDYIGAVSVSGLPAMTSTIVEVPWSTVPDPLAFNESSVHCCLIARFVSGYDPMTYPEVTNVAANVRNNNNIAARNVWAGHGPGPRVVLGYGNPMPVTGTFSLHFGQTSGSGSYYDNGTVTVDLGAELYAIWAAGGSSGVNVTPLSDESDNTSVVISGDARLDNLSLDPFQQFSIEVQFGTEYNAEVAGQIYEFSLGNYMVNQAGENEEVGGAAMSVEMPSEAGKRAVSPGDAGGAVYQLSARPNPTGGATTISYQLPVDTRVTVGVYDAAGNLVRTLLTSVDQKRGEHQIEWNGLTVAGDLAPVGTYFYRLQAGERRMEGQIKIVR